MAGLFFEQFLILIIIIYIIICNYIIIYIAYFVFCRNFWFYFTDKLFWSIAERNERRNWSRQRQFRQPHDYSDDADCSARSGPAIHQFHLKAIYFWDPDFSHFFTVSLRFDSLSWIWDHKSGKWWIWYQNSKLMDIMSTYWHRASHFLEIMISRLNLLDFSHFLYRLGPSNKLENQNPPWGQKRSESAISDQTARTEPRNCQFWQNWLIAESFINLNQKMFTFFKCSGWFLNFASIFLWGQINLKCRNDTRAIRLSLEGVISAFYRSIWHSIANMPWNREMIDQIQESVGTLQKMWTIFDLWSINDSAINQFSQKRLIRDPVRAVWSTGSDFENVMRRRLKVEKCQPSPPNPIQSINSV